MNSWSKKRSIIKRYNATSDSYDAQYREEQDAKYKAALNALGNPKAGYSAVLDVGCGSGLFFPHITHKAQAVVGVDVSCNLLLKAKTQTKQFGNAHLVQADADHLPFKNAAFSAVFSFTMLQNMPKPKQTLCEFKRVTMLDGCLVVTGLKKAFAPTVFLDLFEDADLKLSAFIDDDALKCYVAVAALF